MHTIETIYKGELRTSITHLKSGAEIITDAPTDNQGKGEAFSPTDMVAAALGSCILTILGIADQTHQLQLEGTRVKICKIMEDKPRRIGEIVVDITFPHKEYTDKQKNIIKQIAYNNCPVSHSLHPDIKQTINLNF